MELPWGWVSDTQETGWSRTGGAQPRCGIWGAGWFSSTHHMTWGVAYLGSRSGPWESVILVCRQPQSSRGRGSSACVCVCLCVLDYLFAPRQSLNWSFVKLGYEGGGTHLLCFSKGLFSASPVDVPQKLFTEDLFSLPVLVFTIWFF